jgi:high affinity sulfate transporter 1
MLISWLKRNIPILTWLPNYDRSWLTVDAIAGLTVWGLVVPESMAYAGVAGLPPQFGLYTLAVSLLVYALLGTSRHLFVQPTSATAALIASSVTAILVTTGIVTDPAVIDPVVYQQYAVAFAIVVGLVFLAASLARLGFITQFLSKPVLDGFVTGLAVYVMVGQLNKFFGLEKPAGNTVQKFFTIVRELPQANWVTFAIGMGALALLILLPRWNKRIPAGLIVLFGSIFISSAFQLHDNYGVHIVGELPQGLPSFSRPAVPLNALLLMLAPAVGVLLVSFSQSLGVAREYSDKHDYEIDPNRELTAFAVINVASGLFGGQIAGGSMAPSAVNDGAGGRSEVSSLVTWGAVILTLSFLTPLFTNLPETVLAALIIHALWHIVSARKLHYARLVSRTEFVLGLLTFAGVIFIDVLQGMLLGLISAILVIIFRSSRPHLSRLGKMQESGAYSDLTRHPEAVPVPGMLIIRFDAPLYYANAITVRDEIMQRIGDADRPLRAVIFDAAVQDDLDITSSEMLKSLVKRLHDQGIPVYFADVHKPVMEFGAKTGLLDLIGTDHVFSTVDLAVRHIENSTDPDPIKEGIRQ